MKIFDGAAHEKFPPDAALRHSQLAPEAGFDGVYCSDHFQRLSTLKELGATSIAVMNCSGADPEGAIRIYAERVLPELRS
jgi:hypothetical protein